MTGDKTEEEKFYEAYKLMIQARNFHFDHFNKWMNFFYVADAAILYAYANIKTEAIELKPLLSIFGLIISFWGYLSCKGYYFWIYNWIKLIARHEKKLKKEYRIYSIFSKETEMKNDSMLNPLNSANVSTSKITLLFFLTICIIWSYLLVHSFANKLGWNAMPEWLINFVIPVLIPYLLIVIAWLFQRFLKSQKQVDDKDLYV